VEEGTLGTFVYQSLNDLQINVHLSCCRNPPSSEVSVIWNDNKESLLRFIELSYSRVYGKVSDANGAPVKDATIHFSGTKAFTNVSAESGFYAKYLTPTKYVAVAEHDSLDVMTHDILITGKTPVRQDFLLLKKPEFKHHKYNELVEQLDELKTLCPSVLNVSSFGMSVEGRNLWMLEISDNPGEKEAGEPEFSYIAGWYILII